MTEEPETPAPRPPETVAERERGALVGSPWGGPVTPEQFVEAVEEQLGQRVQGFYRELLLGIARTLGAPAAPKGDAD
jgi:hypothetical protein